jgi:recombination protein RecT
MSSKLASALAAGRELTPYERFKIQFQKLAPEIAALVGKDKVDRFMRVALNAVQATPDVLNADRRSLFLACMEAAQDGLLPDGREAVFNIYRTKNKEASRRQGADVYDLVVQYLPMVYGLVQLIYEAGATYVDAVAVYQQDDFTYLRGDDPKIIHEPTREDDPGPIIAAYVVVKMKTGETKREVMYRRDIEKVRSKSKAPDGLMWKDFYDQAAIKSVIHRVFKQLPKSDRLERALAHDNAAAGLADVTPTDTGAVDLVSLVDGRLDQDLRTVPTPTKTAEPIPSSAEIARKEEAAGGLANASHDRFPDDTASKATPAKPGDPGTPELKAQYLSVFAATQEIPVLDLKADEVRFFKWADADVGDLMTAYRARRAELETK